MQQVQENVFTTDSFSQLDLHPHLVSGRKAACHKNVDFWVEGRELLFMVTWILHLILSLKVLVHVLTCPQTVPAFFIVCSCNTKKPQKTSNGVILIN